MPIHASFDDLDDPHMDLPTARIVDGLFTMEGWIDTRGLLNATIRRRGKHRLTLTASSAQSFEVVDEAGTGVLIPEEIAIGERQALITGVIPATLSLVIDGPTEVVFNVDEAPFEIRGGFRWAPA